MTYDVFLLLLWTFGTHFKYFENKPVHVINQCSKLDKITIKIEMNSHNTFE